MEYCVFLEKTAYLFRASRRVFRIVVSIVLILFSIIIEVNANDGSMNYDNDTTLDFEWKSAKGDVDHYRVFIYEKSPDKEYKDIEDEYVLKRVENTENDEPKYKIKNCLDGYIYKIKVAAVDAAGNVGPMSEESESVLCRPIEPVTDLQAVVSDDSILLTWTASADAVSYNIYRDTVADFTPDKTNRDNQIAGNIKGDRWIDLSDGVVGDININYFYAVTAVNVEGRESEPSNKIGEFDFKLIHNEDKTSVNVISLPFILTDNLQKCSDLAAYIETADLISKWNAELQKYEDFIPVRTELNDFDLKTGEAYFVSVNQNTVITLTGRIPKEDEVIYSLAYNGDTEETSFNMLVIPLERTDLEMASDLAAELQYVELISEWNPKTQTYRNFVPDLPDLNNFEIKPGKAYFISITNDFNWP